MFLFYVFSSKISENKRAKQVLPGSGVGRGEVAQIMYIHVSKFKNDQIKFFKKNINYNEISLL
jgi:hypothetical protein